MKDVDNFLKQFHYSSNLGETFSYNCSYWFAAILFGRFIREGANIMYDASTCHFGTKIKDKIYDITGDVTNKYNWISWDSVSGDDREKIISEFIMF